MNPSLLGLVQAYMDAHGVEKQQSVEGYEQLFRNDSEAYRKGFKTAGAEAEGFLQELDAQLRKHQEDNLSSIAELLSLTDEQVKEQAGKCPYTFALLEKKANMDLVQGHAQINGIAPVHSPSTPVVADPTKGYLDRAAGAVVDHVGKPVAGHIARNPWAYGTAAALGLGALYGGWKLIGRPAVNVGHGLYNAGVNSLDRFASPAHHVFGGNGDDTDPVPPSDTTGVLKINPWQDLGAYGDRLQMNDNNARRQQRAYYMRHKTAEEQEGCEKVQNMFLDNQVDYAGNQTSDFQNRQQFFGRMTGGGIKAVAGLEGFRHFGVPGQLAGSYLGDRLGNEFGRRINNQIHPAPSANMGTRSGTSQNLGSVGGAIDSLKSVMRAGIGGL